MSDEKMAKELESQQEEQIAGGYQGKQRSYGYCPYTEDRGCRMEIVGGFDNNNEICQDCGWRAW